LELDGFSLAQFGCDGVDCFGIVDSRSDYFTGGSDQINSI